MGDVSGLSRVDERRRWVAPAAPKRVQAEVALSVVALTAQATFDPGPVVAATGVPMDGFSVSEILRDPRAALLEIVDRDGPLAARAYVDRVAQEVGDEARILGVGPSEVAGVPMGPDAPSSPGSPENGVGWTRDELLLRSATLERRLDAARALQRAMRELDGELAEEVRGFEGRAVRFAQRVLDTSEAQVVLERERYGVQRELVPALKGSQTVCTMADNEATRELARIAGELAQIRGDHHLRIRNLEAEASLLLQSKRSILQAPQQIASVRRSIEIREQLAELRAAYARTLTAYSADHPILAAVGALDQPDDLLPTLAAGPSPQAARVLSDAIESRLQAIRAMHTRLDAGGSVIWQLDALVEGAMLAEQTDPSSRLGLSIRDHQRTVERNALVESAVLASLSLGVGLLAAIPSGGTSLALALATLAEAALTARDVRSYALQSDAARSHFDARSSLSHQPPSPGSAVLGMAGVAGGVLSFAARVRGALRLARVLREVPESFAPALAAIRRGQQGPELARLAEQGWLKLDIQGIRKLGDVARLRAAGDAAGAAQLTAAIDRTLGQEARVAAELMRRHLAGELGDCLPALLPELAPPQVLDLADQLGASLPHLARDLGAAELVEVARDVRPQALQRLVPFLSGREILDLERALGRDVFDRLALDLGRQLGGLARSLGPKALANLGAELSGQEILRLHKIGNAQLKALAERLDVATILREHYLPDQCPELVRALAARGDFPGDLKRAGTELYARLAVAAEVDERGARSVFARFVGAEKAHNAQEYLAELKNLDLIRTQGRVAPGEVIYSGVKQGATVKIGGKPYELAGADIMDEADALYLDRSGVVIAEEVKHRAVALQEKLKEDPTYLERLANWCRQAAPGETRRATVVIGREEGWTALFGQFDGLNGRTVVLRELAWRKIGVRIGSRELPPAAVARLWQLMEPRLKAPPQHPGFTWRQFFATIPTLADVERLLGTTL